MADDYVVLGLCECTTRRVNRSEDATHHMVAVSCMELAKPDDCLVVEPFDVQALQIKSFVEVVVGVFKEFGSLPSEVVFIPHIVVAVSPCNLGIGKGITQSLKECPACLQLLDDRPLGWVFLKAADVVVVDEIAQYKDAIDAVCLGIVEGHRDGSDGMVRHMQVAD